jgi:hypothetical protein
VPTGGEATTYKARRDNKDAIQAHMSATCAGPYNVFFNWTVTRQRDGRVWSGSSWLLIRGDCTLQFRCERDVLGTKELAGGSFTGTDVFNVSFLDSTGAACTCAMVYPPTLFPPIFPPSGTPLETFYVANIPATF